MRFLGEIRGHRAWPVAVAVLIALLAIAAWRLGRQSRFVDRWFHGQIVELPDGEVEAWLRGYAESRGEAALPLLVQDLTSDREAVRAAARNELMREVDSWKRLPPERAAAHAVTIAVALRHLPRNNSSLEAETIAWRVYRWSSSESCPETTRNRLTVLLHGVSKRPAPVAALGDFAASQRTFHVVPAAVATPKPSPIDVPATFEPPSEAPARVISVREVSSTAPQSPPKRTTAPSLSLPMAGSNGVMAADDWDLAPRPVNSAHDETKATKPAPEPPLEQEVATKASVRELFQLLQTASRADAEAELLDRGFQDEQIELARHLSSTDAEERRAWTVALPRVSRVDAREWLKWMTEDPDVQVRRSAVTLLATMPDEATLELLRQIAASDPDPGVRRLASGRVSRQ